MDLQINQLMAALTKIRIISVLINCVGLCIVTSAQSSDCDVIKIKKDILKTEFGPKDTIQFSFMNTGQNKIKYYLEAQMLANNEWFYSDYYTRYFNRKMSYKELERILKSKLPYVAPKNYSIPVRILQPKTTARISFVVNDTINLRRLIRFRLHFLKDTDICVFKSLSPFYFVRID
jgi:hypothetical protein